MENVPESKIKQGNKESFKISCHIWGLKTSWFFQCAPVGGDLCDSSSSWQAVDMAPCEGVSNLISPFFRT